jgi:protease-4
MKDFFKMLFASTLGVFIASFILFFFSLIVFVGIAASFGSRSTFNLQKDSILRIDLSGFINEQEITNPFNFLMSGSTPNNLGLNDIIAAIEKAKENDKIRGIYLRAGNVAAGYATMEAIRNALLDFKESGKFIIAYGEIFSQQTYYLSSVADGIYMNPEGMFDFRGLGTTIQFDRGILEKWGIEMQVFKVGTYKSAVEPFIQDQMSDANKQQTLSYLNDIWTKLLSGISESRNISIEQLNQYADECLLFAKQETLVAYNLIDGLKYESDMSGYLKEMLGINASDNLKVARVRELNSVPEFKKTIGTDQIAILYAEGPIIMDELTGIFPGRNISAKRYVRELHKLKEDENVKAVVFRINSPGGSAYAAEQIWYAVEKLKEVKPVVVSMGDYAASGGYYIACNANKIVSEPSTLTGSIGIFGLIPNGAQLAKRMGATYDEVATNKHSNLGGAALSIPFIGLGLLPARPLNEDESMMLQAFVERGYDLFLTRCAEGRGKTKEEIDAIGQGRVWTGNQALELGLVDELGGVDIALQTAAELAEIQDYSISEFPVQRDFFTALLEESTSSIKMQITKGIIGKELYEQKRMLNAWQNYDYRQAIMEEFMY